MAVILCFGDSVTQGMVDPEGGWPQRLRARLDREQRLDLGAFDLPAHATLNLGISGDTAAGLLDRLERELLPRRLVPQLVVVIAIGLNDTAVDAHGEPACTEEDFAERLRGLAATAARHSDQVAFVGLLPVDEACVQPAPWSPDGDESYRNDRIRAFDRVIARTAAGHGAAHVALFDDALRRGHPALLHEGFHPNASGHQLIADAVHTALGPWLAP